MKCFVLSLALCYFVLAFFSPISIVIILLGEERANLSAFCAFVRFALVWFRLLPLPLRARDGLRLVIRALPGLFSLFFPYMASVLPLFVPHLYFFRYLGNPSPTIISDLFLSCYENDFMLSISPGKRKVQGVP